MTSREIVRSTITFQAPPRFPVDFIGMGGTDFAGTSMWPNPDHRPGAGKDEWGAVWTNVGVSRMGEVTTPALADWDDFPALTIPDISQPERWRHLTQAREKAGDRFLLGTGISIYERVHFIRGLENTWMDILEAPDKLRRLIAILVEMNLIAIERYAAAGVDGLYFCDDWGLQDRLMIAPAMWRAIWKPAYREIYQAAHAAGLFTFLHSCGNIVDILDDLIEIGLDVIQMDQQENMGLDNLSRRFAGRITFWCPVDIQNTMQHGSEEEIRVYCRRLFAQLGTARGGFIAREYGDPKGAGHSAKARAAMRAEFWRLARRWPEPSGGKS